MVGGSLYKLIHPLQLHSYKKPKVLTREAAASLFLHAVNGRLHAYAVRSFLGAYRPALSRMTNQQIFKLVHNEILSDRLLVIQPDSAWRLRSSERAVAQAKPKPKVSEPLQVLPELTWIEFQVIDENDEPIADLDYKLILPDDTIEKGKTDSRGVVRVEELEKGLCSVFFPALEKASIKPWAAPQPTPEKTWIEVLALDENKEPLSEEPFKLVLPGGEVREGKLDKLGVLRLAELDPGECVLSFPQREEIERSRVAPPPDKPIVAEPNTWIEVVMLDESGQPVSEEDYKIELPDGTIKEGKVGKDGRAWIEDIPPGECKLSFPQFDESEKVEQRVD